MASFIHAFPHTHPTALEGGKKQLGAFNPLTDKLYIIAHGHKQMPVFACNKQRWTASELVKLLNADGLPTTWREIELLVCHAGESVNSVKIGGKLMGIQQQAVSLKAQGVASGSRAMKQLEQKFNTTAAKGLAPSAFTSDDQLLPLVAQFVHTLKTHTPPYTNFRVISYGAKVAQNFSSGTVSLDLRDRGGAWDEPLSKYPHLIKIWH
jgi:hypothetical protein